MNMYMHIYMYVHKCICIHTQRNTKDMFGPKIVQAFAKWAQFVIIKCAALDYFIRLK